MSRQLYQFDKFQPQQSSNIQSTVSNDYSTCELNLSDTDLNDLFSEFDVNIDDFHTSTNNINYPQSISDLSLSYDTILHPTSMNNNMQNLGLVSSEVLSQNTYNPLIEQYHESSPTNMSNYQSDHVNHTQQQMITNDSLLSVQLPSVTKKPEPISVTLDQLQLILANTDTSQSNFNTIIGHNIPLKIVHQTTNNQDSNSSDDSNHQDSLTNTDGNAVRTRRKPSHNAIEKRYRSSINEKIHELKEIVAANDGKIQKSGILQRTIKYIRQLQSTNQRLEEENSTLKNILKQLNLTNDDSTSHNHLQTRKRHSNEETFIPVTKRQKQTNDKRNLADKSRLVLCYFTLCILITNPLNYLLSSSNNFNTNEIQSTIHSRTLKSIIENENIYSLITWKQLILWLLNTSICLICLIKLFIYQEPILHESDIDEYYSYKKLADQYMNENQLDEAYVYYRKCCEKLSVLIDETYLYYFTTITWQITRLCFNLIYIKNNEKSFDYNLKLTDCFLQIWKIEYNQSKSLLKLINIFLLTLNASINSKEKLDKNKRNEIYLLSILTFKNSNKLFLILIKYLLSINKNDIWLFDNHHLFKQQSFIQSILYNNSNEFEQLSWWQHTLQILHCISSNQQNINNITLYQEKRLKQFIDERYIMIVERIHHILRRLTDENDQKNLIKQLGESSEVLTSMIENNRENNFDLAIKILLLDGILSLRLRLLTNLIRNNHQDIPFIEDFQRELKYYKQLNQLMKLPKQRYYLFESIFRVSIGLNPLITQTLFECAIHTKKEVSLNLDVIAALLLFCHFFPSTIYRYRNILQQAVHISFETNKNTGLNHLQQQCLKLIHQPYFTL